MAAPNETIFALASGPLPAAIALLRISGPDTLHICEQLIDGFIPKHGQARLRTLVDAERAVIDHAVVTVFVGPKSYTGEDTIELSLHGGGFIVEQVYGRLLELGARLADPGEFTRRAFEAGKLDLTQVEAVADLIDADSEAQHKLALQQLGGSLSSIYEGWHDELVKALAALEVFIDFPDEGDVGGAVASPALKVLKQLSQDMRITLKKSGGAERVREGFLVAIMGPPNAGKSSLLNALAGHEVAIVTDIPGTTRDFVEIKLRVGPYLVRFSDTAGLRETADQVEQVGIARARKRAQEADIRLWLSSNDTGGPSLIEAGLRDLFIRTKSDLQGEKGEQDVSREALPLSSLTGEGLDALRAILKERLDIIAKPGVTPGLTQLRHRRAIESAIASLERAIVILSEGGAFELAGEDVRLAARSIASLTGRIDIEEVLGSIFSDFCIGK